MECKVIGSIDEVSAAQWNNLAGSHIPFLRHEFLAALERNHCVGEEHGWLPQHLLIFDDERLVGAIPQYLKTNSYGELVFDWNWADAYARVGMEYYPKLVVAIPYTPATGPRLLVSPEADHCKVSASLIEHALEHARNLQVSSLHWLFPHQEDLQRLQEHGLMPRLGCQYHWYNNEYRDFDDFLDRFTSSKRKKVRRERRDVKESGVTLHPLHGNELSAEQWRAVHRHYKSTFDRRWGYATLSLDFFVEISRTMPEQLLVFLAQYEDRPVASAICFRDNDTLYGRHWGCDEHFRHLHFEACYYQGLEYCIRHGLKKFDPGAQGEHKISRGFLPTPTWSAHWIADDRFRQAIGNFLQQETVEMRNYIRQLSQHSPYKDSD